MTPSLKVVRSGLFDTVQDLGRIGFMALGMPTAGAPAIRTARPDWRSA
jgi:allophanate hydrolase subunit 2